jgi:hypothetical protein
MRIPVPQETTGRQIERGRDILGDMGELAEIDISRSLMG